MVVCCRLLLFVIVRCCVLLFGFVCCCLLFVGLLLSLRLLLCVVVRCCLLVCVTGLALSDVACWCSKWFAVFDLIANVACSRLLLFAAAARCLLLFVR